MNRAALLRIAAAVFGGLVVVGVLSAFVGMNSAGGPLAWSAGSPAGWAVPVVAGATVGVLSWLLLGGENSADASSDGPQTVDCPVCGTELLEEWRLCPYCGVKCDESGAEEVYSTRSA